MKFFKIIFTILGIIFTINLASTLMEWHIKGKAVYACEEVDKYDPIDVQRICERRWRRK